MTSPRRFPLRSYGDDFSTGCCANGDQALLGLLCPRLVLYRFDSTGRPIGRDVRQWSFPAPQRGGVFDIFDSEFRRHLQVQIAAWKLELGFREQQIAVEEFFDPENAVGIELPEDKSCDFVFWWAKDYWMNSSGEVEST